MTKTVWKYEINKNPNIDKLLELPAGASPLRVGMQEGKMCLWACVCPDSQKETRIFRYTGTGDPVPMSATYVGSCSHGPFEWHLWEIKFEQEFGS